MFEAKLLEGMILKKIVESIKDIVTDVNIDISPSGTIFIPILYIIFAFFAILTSEFVSVY